MKRIILLNIPHWSKFVLENPVVLMIVTTWKEECRKDSPRELKTLPYRLKVMRAIETRTTPE